VANIGREARLELEIERRGGRTVVAHAYAEPPFRIGRAFELDDAVYLIVACSGPGIFAGDTLRQSVTVGPGARAVLTSQAALQIHPSPAPIPASVFQQYRLETGAELHCYWDPVIPFARARIVQRFDLHVHSTSKLMWSDAVMSGRMARGETWQFETLDHELRLSREDALEYLERYCLSPAECPPSRRWVAGQMNYLATTIVHHRRVDADATDALWRELQTLDDIRSGVDLVSPGVLVARFMAERGAPFAAARARCRQIVLKTLFESPQLVGRKSV
jgi:urease accessory protein UreH